MLRRTYFLFCILLNIKNYSSWWTSHLLTTINNKKEIKSPSRCIKSVYLSLNIKQVKTGIYSQIFQYPLSMHTYINSKVKKFFNRVKCPSKKSYFTPDQLILAILYSTKCYISFNIIVEVVLFLMTVTGHLDVSWATGMTKLLSVSQVRAASTSRCGWPR